MTTTTTKQTVLRYVLTNLGENLVMMPATAKIVAVQPHKKGVEIYALAAGVEGAPSDFPAGEPEPRRFFVAKTGETVADAATYLATAMLPTMKARHIFELV